MRIWTVSNGFSFLRLLLVIPLILIVQEEDFSRTALLVIMLGAYVTDLLDGFIARKFGQESEFGRIIDPLADKLFIFGTVISFLLAGLLPLWFVLVVLLRDVLIFFAGIFLRHKTGILAQSNYTGKAAVVAVGITLLISLFKDDMEAGILDGAMYVSLALMAASLWSYGSRFGKLLNSRTS